MSKHRTDVGISGQPMPQSWFQALMEFIGTLASNFTLSQLSSTAIQVVAGAGSAQVAIGIEGKWRYIAATTNTSHPGGAAGSYDIYAIASANAFSGSGVGETDSTDYTFGLAIVTGGGAAPTGSFNGHPIAHTRKVGTLTWSGTAITDIQQSVGSGGLSLAQVALAIQARGTLAGIPVASGGNANYEYFAADDHGGTPYVSNGVAWVKKSASVNGEWPLGSVVEWPWAAGGIPAYTALPYGQSLLAATYPDLAVLDNIAPAHPHGSVALNIVMPDYRGRVGVGKDDMGGSAANRITVAVSGVAGTTLGAVFGAEGITLTTGQLPAHTHGVTGAPSLTDPGHSHNIQTRDSNTGGGNFVERSSDVNTDQDSTTRSATTGISVGVGSLGTASVGSGSAHQNTQPSIIVNKLMRVL